MIFQDLRQWMDQVKRMGDLEVVVGADWDGEIGAIVDLWKIGGPALLFDEIKGYPKGYRVLAHSGTSVRRVALSLGLDPVDDKQKVVNAIRERFRTLRLIPPVVVKEGPVFENVLEETDVDLYKFPSPKWHERDGGRFIGTGCLCITKDPDTGWVNLGGYRVMIHDEKTAGTCIHRGKHGQLMMEKYWKQGKSCPIAVCVGQDPLLFLLSGIEVPHGISEYDFAGGLRGKPVSVIESDLTGIPIPSTAEIVLEGEIPPGEERLEGPFGEWNGYYAEDAHPRPIMKVKRILYRNDPIILGVMPGRPPSDNTYYFSLLRSAWVWDELEKAGVQGVVAVNAHEAGSGRMLLIVAIEQRYPGHAKQAGLIAAQCHQGAYSSRFVIVVDKDIDPDNLSDVFWALCTRADLKDGVDVIHRCWTSPADLMHYPEGEGKAVFGSRMIIDACKPFERREKFRVVETSKELKEKIAKKHASLFERNHGPRF